jgi:streptogramin lyase
VYVADSGNDRIRKISPAGVVTTLAGSGTDGYADGIGTAARFNHPTGVAVDTAGNVYVTDAINNRIRKISPAGVVTTLVGTAAHPFGVAVDNVGNVYVAEEYGNGSIQKISFAGVVTTLAGSGTQGFADGTGTAAQFNHPRGIAVDSVGNVYVADSGNNRIRKIEQ